MVTGILGGGVDLSDIKIPPQERDIKEKTPENPRHSGVIFSDEDWGVQSPSQHSI